MTDARRQLEQAGERYQQAQRELERARELLIDELLAARSEGWTQRELEEAVPVSRMTMNTWLQRRLRATSAAATTDG